MDPDLDPHWLKSWIRIRIETKADPQHCFFLQDVPWRYIHRRHITQKPNFSASAIHSRALETSTFISTRFSSCSVYNSLPVFIRFWFCWEIGHMGLQFLLPFSPHILFLLLVCTFFVILWIRFWSFLQCCGVLYARSGSDLSKFFPDSDSTPRIRQKTWPSRKTNYIFLKVYWHSKITF